MATESRPPTPTAPVARPFAPVGYLVLVHVLLGVAGVALWVVAAGRSLADAQGAALVGALLSIALVAASFALFRQLRRSESLARARREVEDRFRSYFDLPLVGAALTSPEKGWIAVNDRMCAMLGYTREELAARTWAELTHPEDLARDEREFARVLAGEQDGYTIDKRFVCKDGAVVWVRLAVQCVRRADGAVDYFAALADDQTEQKRALDRLRESEERFARAFAAAPIMMTLSRLDDGTYLDVNERFSQVSGFSRDEAIGRRSVDLGWVSAPDRTRLRDALLRDGRVDGLELELRAKDGEAKASSYSGVLITVGGERCLLSIAQDLTRERALQRTLEQAQKLESVGRLAGGVAHDFNNMLAVIRGYSELLLAREGLDPDVREDLDQIREAAERSAQVTSQLLAFARKQVVAPKVLDLNDTVGGMLKMLRRLLGETIELGWGPGSALRRVRVDPSQIDQVLANLCVNARDAIDGSGRIAIATENATLDAEFCARHEGLSPGAYVCLSVSDTGSGIEAHVLPYLFEPFFTTKDVGRGSGLGLATVYGIARQNGGTVVVESRAGAGATFRLYFPVVDDDVAVPTPRPSHADLARGHGETVLVVEDEPAVLRLCTQLLGRLGYRVLAAGGVEEALALAGAHAGAIRLLVTDVVMPVSSGLALAERLLAKNPGLRCVFMSGYTPDAAARQHIERLGGFVQKPFEAGALAACVRDALAGAALA